MVFWVGEGGVIVWWDVFFVEYLLVVCREFFWCNFNVFGGLLLQHVPDFFWLVFEDLGECELHSGSFFLACVFEFGVGDLRLHVFLSFSAFGLSVVLFRLFAVFVVPGC